MYSCRFCDKPYKKNGNLLRHLKAKHAEDIKIEEEKAKAEYELKQKIKKAEPEEEIETTDVELCNICSEPFDKVKIATKRYTPECGHQICTNCRIQ